MASITAVPFSLLLSPTRQISTIFLPLHLGLRQGCTLSSLMFNTCEAICHSSGPRASLALPGLVRRLALSGGGSRPPSAGSAGRTRVRGCRFLWGGGVAARCFMAVEYQLLREMSLQEIERPYGQEAEPEFKSHPDTSAGPSGIERAGRTWSVQVQV